jgi:hypothetical protein
MNGLGSLVSHGSRRSGIIILVGGVGKPEQVENPGARLLRLVWVERDGIG